MVLALAGTAVASIFYIQEFAKIDPLLNMGKRSAGPNQQLGMSLGNVKLIHYSGKRRISEATMDKVFITKDRSTYNMEGVSHGAYITKEGKRMNFSAPRAVWNARGRVLNATDGVRVWNKDLDLKTALFRMNERDQILYVPGRVNGKFYDGKLTANNFRYDIPIGYAKFGPVVWDGNLALDLQDGGQPQRKQWKIESAGGDYKDKNGVQSFEKGTATDFDIIIKADLIQLEKKTDIVTATGNVRYYSAKANLTCEKAVIYRKEKRAVLTGAVDMLVKPKDKQSKAVVEEIPPFRPVVPKEIATDRPEAPPTAPTKNNQIDDDLQNAKTLRQYPTAITAEKVEYWYAKGSRRAIITGAPQARQELPEGRWRHMWAHEAHYNGETEFLTLLSRAGKADARAQTSIGDDVIAEKVIVSTKEGDDDMEAKNVKATVYGKPDEDGDVGPKPPDPIKPKTGGGNLSGQIGGRRR